MPEGNPNATANDRRNETKESKTKPVGDTPADAGDQAAGSIATSAGETAASTGLASAAIGAGASGNATTDTSDKNGEASAKRDPDSSSG
ncbi:hypothetical protein [Mesorhizobium sp. M2C.T.Ca.TU.002.02.1.1]|uniref:hypothetical protein n=1 Tax=Mesorhizobium sp. M2C.T.Ca.TU.002.02.1.1 TaxID=2496788 RepID=UPI000FCC532E|nr:hypothetical protein [Mesorhizobium sp. M2C.T.Ca.TU.002.02.1.1]RUU68726.1 hypothetical protein EOD04_13170 [Mesorhizobium sp. M2C.T.Ca.TU.009.01.2.1]